MIKSYCHITPKRRASFRGTLSAIFLVASAGFSLQAQTETTPEYQVKSVFLYNFTHFVEWPVYAFESNYSPFVIGVIGGDPFGTYLDQTIAEERTGSHIIRVVRYNSIKDIGACHILYVAAQDPEEIREILQAVSQRPILTVGDTPNFTRWGGMVRFYTEAGKIRLQVNNTLAKENGLKISSKLLRVAQVL